MVANRNWRNHDLSIAFVTPTKPTYATYRYQIQPVLMDENRNEIEGNQVGSLCIKFPWPGIARTIWVTIRGIRILIFQPFRNLFHRRRCFTR
jgi:acyl-coenzyme A synthetase/AMP-(fatty) acid ligase